MIRMNMSTIWMDYIQTPIQLVAKTVNQDFTVNLASKKIARLVLIVNGLRSFIHHYVQRDLIAKEGHSWTPYLALRRHTPKLARLNAKAVLLDISVMVVNCKTVPKELISNFPTQFFTSGLKFPIN